MGQRNAPTRHSIALVNAWRTLLIARCPSMNLGPSILGHCHRSLPSFVEIRVFVCRNLKKKSNSVWGWFWVSGWVNCEKLLWNQVLCVKKCFFFGSLFKGMWVSVISGSLSKGMGGQYMCWGSVRSVPARNAKCALPICYPAKSPCKSQSSTAYLSCQSLYSLCFFHCSVLKWSIQINCVEES